MSSRERNRESDGKIEVFESVKKETVQVRESRGFHVRSRRKPCKCGEIRGFRALSRRKRCKCGEISGLCVRPLRKPCKCGEIHGFRVRSRRKPCKCEEPGVSMSRRDGNRPSAGYSGFPCPTAPETVHVRGNSGCPCPAAMETVQVRGNSGFSCPTARWKPRKCGKPLPYKKIYLQAKIGSYPSSYSPFCLLLPCVVVFVTALRVFGRPSCLLALRCVWVPLLPTRVALPLVAQPWPCRIKKSTSKPKLVLIRPPARLSS